MYRGTSSRSDIVSVVFRPSLLLLLASSVSLAHAEVRLPKILSSHMVLQRDRPIHVWGWAEPGENVSVQIQGATQSATANQLGEWTLYLPPLPAGGPFTLTVKSSNNIVLNDILMGDVWFASGQSNMEMPLRGFPGNAVLKNGDEEIKNALQPQMRLLLVRHAASPFPLHDFDETAWTVCSPESARNFSAVAYFFGRDIQNRLHVPIGLIDSTWGGTPVEAWMSMNVLSSDTGFMPVFAVHARMLDEQANLAAHIQAKSARMPLPALRINLRPNIPGTPNRPPGRPLSSLTPWSPRRLGSA